MEKKEAARLLFMEGDEQKNIARLLGVSEVSISKWVKDGDWRSRRTMRSLFEQTSVEAMKELAEYQLQALIHKKNELVRKGEFQLLDNSYFDAMSKAFSNIKGAELKWEHAVRLMRRFVEHLEGTDPDLAKLIIQQVDVFLNDLRKQMHT